ncbi:zinc-finger homeodomain protein 9-like [Primulina tabacum]|uniref:zinc-finger homeodomain protein 9-like n=1 Tax=Primulina tabacum TaxID=48773 RepID=UPI003F5A1C78
MDLSNSTVKTPEAETETPTRIPPAKLSPFSNGLLRRHAPLQLQLHHHPVVVTYKECLKNHAAALGGHAVDGCGEFMPSSNSSSSDPTSFKCAACGCHRNFHRRDPDEPPLLQPPNAVPALEFHPHHRHHPPRANSGDSPNDSPSPPPISSSYYPSAPHMLLALSHGLTTTPDSSITHITAAINPTSTPVSNPGSRKRFRTRFTQDQKEKMQELADRLGWRMQRKEEDLINEFCTEIGVDKGVFKVWMHNNKNTSGKNKDHQLTLSNNSTAMSSPPAAATSNSVNYSDFSSPTAALYHQQEDNNNGSKQIVGGQEMNHQLHLQD